MNKVRRSSLRVVSRLSLLAIALALLAGVGCGKGKRASVSGKVLFNGQPVPAGTVSFVGAKNRTGSGNIGPDGRYTVNDAPVGEVTIIVNVPKPPPLGMMGGNVKPKAPKEGGMKNAPPEMLPSGADLTKIDPKVLMRFQVPDKYTKADTSPLKFTVEAGTQEYDIKIP